LPLDRMSLDDKLAILEDLWDDLRRSSADVTSPAWHRDVLVACEARVKAGTARFMSLDEARAQIDKATR
jgi:hypothetical protein